MEQSGSLDKRFMGCEGKDLISNLPKSLIGHILSLLPIKDAVHISVLSKNWTLMWTLITNLHFDDRACFTCKRTFVKFVDRVLRQLTNSTLQSFSLTTSSSFDSYSRFVKAWFSAVLARKIQKLNIDYSGKFNFPSQSLFECKSLVELKLMLPNCILKIPASLCLPNLEVLHLSSMTLICNTDSSNHQKELILSFPVLRVVIVKGSKWSSAIRICTMSLSTFIFEGNELENIVVSDQSSAYNATVEFTRNSDDVKVYHFQICKLLRQLNQMKYLKLWTIKIHDKAGVEDTVGNLPEFRTLCSLDISNVTGKVLLGLLHKSPSLETLVLNKIHNEVQVEDAFANLPEFRMLRSLDRTQISGKVLLALLRKSPALETFCLDRALPKFDQEMLDFATVPQCLLSSLHVVKLYRFAGVEHEICLAKFLMRNGVALQQMGINFLSLRYLNVFWEEADKMMVKMQRTSFLKYCSCYAFVEHIK